MDEFLQSSIVLGGDQLVRVRMSGAKDLRAGTHTPEDRFDVIHPVIEELFHVEQDFLEKMVKRFFIGESAREVGTLPNMKVMLRRSNVNGKVKGKFQAHEDFVKTVGEGLLVSFCMTKFGIDEVSGSPVIQGLPDNIDKIHVKNRMPYFKQIVGQLVDDLFCRFGQQPQLNTVALAIQGIGTLNINIPTYQLGKPVQLHIPATGQKITFTPAANDPHDDDLLNYSIQFLSWYVHLLEFQDAVSEGDPFRTNINLKRMIPFFYSHSNRSKYAVECIDYILKTEVLLPPNLAMRVRLASFVNPHGKPGGNKPADMQQENNILVLKDVIKGLGAGKTDAAMVRASKAAPVVDEVVRVYQEHLGCRLRSGRHRTRERDEDVKAVLDICNKTHPFVLVPGRALQHYRYIKRNPFFAINLPDFHAHLEKIVSRLKRGMNVDVEYYDV